MKQVVLAIAAVGGGLLFAPSAHAQLLSDQVSGEQRTCTYVGSDSVADGQIIPRRAIVSAAQPCPDIAPYRDPNLPAPSNAFLARETTQNGQRQCVYSQGGVEYSRLIPLAQRCAMTPALLDRAIAARDPGTLARQ